MFSRIPLKLSLVVCFLALALSAITPDWNYNGLSNIVSVAADGKGGCAMIRIDSAGGSSTEAEIVWLDKNGELIYSVPVTNFLIGIIHCDNKNLVYGDIYPSESNVIFHVTSKGEVSQLPADPHTFNTRPYSVVPIYQLPTYDKKGFFAVSTPTNEPGATLIRYLYK